jgi:hypothetical protein
MHTNSTLLPHTHHTVRPSDVDFLNELHIYSPGGRCPSSTLNPVRPFREGGRIFTVHEYHFTLSSPSKTEDVLERSDTGALDTGDSQTMAPDEGSTSAEGSIPATAGAWVYTCNVGVEAEAAGRAVPKSFQALRRDLAVLPWLLATEADLVIAPPPLPDFLAALQAAGVSGMCQFCASLEQLPSSVPITGHRPYGVVGPHLRRSLVGRYREHGVVCHSVEAVRAAVAEQPDERAVLKAEFSSSGLGVRVCEGAQDGATPIAAEGSELARWAANCIARDGALLVEPWLDIVAEFTAEYWEGSWCGAPFPT